MHERKGKNSFDLSLCSITHPTTHPPSSLLTLAMPCRMPWRYSCLLSGLGVSTACLLGSQVGNRSPAEPAGCVV